MLSRGADEAAIALNAHFEPRFFTFFACLRHFNEILLASHRFSSASKVVNRHPRRIIRTHNAILNSLVPKDFAHYLADFFMILRVHRGCSTHAKESRALFR